MSDRLFPVVLYSDVRDVRPRSRLVSLRELESMLTTFIRREEKGGPLWSPVELRVGASRRAASNVRNVSCLVADIDHGGWDKVRNAERALRENVYIVHSTHSHTRSTPSVRLVVPLLVPVKASDWGDVWRRWQYYLWLNGVDVDSHCSDVSRAYYLPSAKPGGHVYTKVNRGKLFKSDALPAPPTGQEVFPAFYEGMNRVSPEVLLRYAVRDAREGRRNARAVWLACQLRDNRYGLDEAEPVMRRYAESVGAGRRSFTEKEALNTLRSVYRTAPRRPWHVVEKKAPHERAY